MKASDRVRAFLGKDVPAGLADMSADQVEDLVLKRGEDLVGRLTAANKKVDELTPRAELGDAMLKARRDECLKAAKFAELGVEEGELPLATAKAIELMTAEELTQATREYQAKADKKVPLRCAKCGSTEISRRSSIDEPPDSPDAEIKFVSPDRGAKSLFGD